MRTLLRGIGLLWKEQAWVIALWLGCAVLAVVAVANGLREAYALRLILSVLVLFPVASYCYGRRRPLADDLSPYAPVESPFLSMRLVRKEMDEVTVRYEVKSWAGAPGMMQKAAPNPGAIDALVVSIRNHTSAPIETDTSYILERQRGLKWYSAKKGDFYEGAWEKVTLPAGETTEVRFSLFGRYDTLALGDWRIVKTFQTEKGEVTLALCFPVDNFGH